MSDILFVQGAGAGTHEEWDVHLVDSLRRELGPSYTVRYPRMPDEANPTLAAWRPVIERELASLGPGAAVVGHSVGGTVLIHALANGAPAVGISVIVLIAAPFIGEGGWPSDEIDPGASLADGLPAVPVLLFHGEEDDEVPVEHVELYAVAIPRARKRRLPGRDHQLNNDLTEVARGIRDPGRVSREVPERA